MAYPYPSQCYYPWTPNTGDASWPTVAVPELDPASYLVPQAAQDHLYSQYANYYYYHQYYSLPTTEPSPVASEPPTSQPGSACDRSPTSAAAAPQGISVSDAKPRSKNVKCKCLNCQNPSSKSASRKHLCYFENCNKSYGKSSHLKAHVRWHLGSRPFACSAPGCGKAFTRSDELSRHLRIHSSEKPFKCSICDKGFTRSDHLAKHLKTHSKTAHVFKPKSHP